MGAFPGKSAVTRHINVQCWSGHPWRARATLHPSERRRRPASARHRLVAARRRTGHKANVVPTAYITHPSFLLHDMGPYHPECPDRLRAIGDRLISSGLDGYLVHHSAPAAGQRDARPRPQPRTTSRRSRPRARSSGLHYLDPDTAMNAHSLTAARHAAGAVVLATDLVVQRRMPHRILRRPPARPPCRAPPRDGLLPLQQRRGRRGARAVGRTGSSAWRSSISTSITATAPKTSFPTIRAC